MHVSASICPGAVQVHFKRNGTSVIQQTTPLDHQVYSPVNKREPILGLEGKTCILYVLALKLGLFLRDLDVIFKL